MRGATDGEESNPSVGKDAINVPRMFSRHKISYTEDSP